MCAFCIPVPVPGLARHAVLPSPPPASSPQLLLLSKLKSQLNHAESTLLQVLILKQLKVPLESITFEKPGEGSPLWLTNCSKRVSVGKVRGNPNLPSSVHTSKFRIPQPLYLPLLRKHRGCGGILPILEPLIPSFPSAARDLLFLSRHSSPATRHFLSQRFLHRRRNDFPNTFAQSRHVFLRQTFGLDRVVQIHRNFRRPKHPVARPVVLERSHQADGYDGNAKLLRHAEAAVLKLVHVTVARALGFRKNNQAGAAVDSFLCQPPHAFQIRRPPHIRNRYVAEALHQPPVRRNLEVRFQLPSAHQLRDGAIQHERIEEIDMVDHEKRSARSIEAGRPPDLDPHAGKKRDAPAKGALQPIMFAGIQENAEKDEHRHNGEEMQAAEDPQNRTTNYQPGALHIYTSTAAGTTSIARHSTVTTSPSTITSTGAASLNSTWRTARREASGCLMCEPSYRRGNVRSSPSRPIGPQRTNSISPSLGSASGAINIVPPVYLLLLNVRKSERPSSHSASSSQRSAMDRRRSCTTRTNTPSKYPRSPNGLNMRLVKAATSAVNPTLKRLNEKIWPAACVNRNRSTLRVRPSISACIEAAAPSFVKSRKKEFPVPSGRKPSAMRCTSLRPANTPLRISCAVPSPPTARKRRYP